jgi:hypothetical protein
MRWLIEGGWNTGNSARLVVRYLSRSPQVDPLLPTLFTVDDLPQPILFPLALARAPYSADARHYLRGVLPELLPSAQSQVLAALAATGELDDFLLVRDFVEDAGNPVSSRVVALHALADQPDGSALLRRWSDPLPQDYQILVALIGRSVLDPDPQLRQWAVDTALAPPATFDEDEALGLRFAAYRAIGRRAAAGDAERLATWLATTLMTTETRTPDGQPWTVLFRFENEFPELAVLLQAYVLCVHGTEGGGEPALPPDFDSSRVAADALVVAAAYLAPVAPRTAGDWFEDLAARSLPLADQLRVAGLSANRLPYGPVADAALDRLLADPDSLLTMPRVIVESFAPLGSGWVLLHDRLAEQRLLARVLQGARPLADLELLLQGWVEDDVLATAADFAVELDTAEGRDLAIRLALRRIDLLPLSAEVHEGVAVVAEALGEDGLAQEQRAVVKRLLPKTDR